MADSQQIVSSSDTEAPTEDRFWTLANFFSLVRVPLIVPIIWLIWRIASGDEYHWYLFWTVMLIIATDILDGAFARRRKQVTEWGKIVDPLADKLAINSIALALILFRELPLWVGVVVIGRDVAIVLAGVFLITKRKIVVPSNIWGKLTTLVMSVLLLSYGVGWDPVKLPLLWAAALLLLASSLSYGLHFIRVRGFDEDGQVADEDQHHHPNA